MERVYLWRHAMLIIILFFSAIKSDARIAFKFSNPNKKVLARYAYASKPAFCDYDKDGDFDMITGSGSGGLYYFENDNGVYSRLSGDDNPFKGMGGGGSTSPTIFDLDRDGDKDLIVGCLNRIIFYENNNGIYTERTGEENPFDHIKPTSYTYYSIAFVDLDKDGDYEAAVGKGYDILYYEYNSGTYTELKGVENPFDGLDVRGNCVPTFGDVDGDNDMDLVVGNSKGTLLYFRNDGGVFSEVEGFESPFYEIGDYGHTHPVIADLENDGKVEVYVGNVDQGIINRLDTYEKAFIREDLSNTPLAGTSQGGYNYRVFEDIDSDGDVDMFVSVQSEGIYFYENIDGVFTLMDNNTNPFNNLRTMGMYQSPAFGDVDMDGDRDALVFDSFGYSYFYENKNGSLIRNASLNPFNNIETKDATPTLIDWDLDGDIDLFMSIDHSWIYYYENVEGEYIKQVNSNNPFSSFTFDSGAPRSKLTFEDIDQDGDLDAFIANRDIYYCENVDGQLIPKPFNESILFENTFFQAPYPAFFDYDGDGDMDLFAGKWCYINVYKERVNNEDIPTTVNRPLQNNLEVYYYNNDIYIKNAEGEIIINLFSLSGKRIKSKKIYNKICYVGELKPGMYIVQVENKNRVQSTKLLIR